jgi:hypothetical protein
MCHCLPHHHCPAPYLKWLHEVELSDIPTVGGKNASLGEMIQNLGKLGVQVPGGFVVTVASYEAFIAHNVLDQKIRDIVAGLDVDDVENIRRTGLAVRTLVKNGKFPEEIWKGILQRYDEMSLQYGQEATDVAVRSSATAEDLPDASFAGQQGDLPQHPRPSGPDQRRAQLLRLALHRPRHRVPRKPRLRPLPSGPFRWASRRWCAPMWAAAAWPSASIPKADSRTWC